MERHKASSQISVDRKVNPGKEGNPLSTNKQNQLQTDLDQLIQQGILDAMMAYDPKFDFTCVPIVVRDQVLRQTRRQTYGLIWNSVRSPTISRLVPEGRSCAFVQILQSPPEWSRYDTDLLLIKLRQKHFLNGLALRDEFVRVLQVILRQDFAEDAYDAKRYSFELKDMDFTRNMIQLVFTGGPDTDFFQLTAVISLLLLVEFDVHVTDFFPDIYASLSHHSDFREYFTEHAESRLTRLAPYNSIKFIFDYSSTEANLCEYIAEKTTPISLILKAFLKLRKEWTKYSQRAAKYATDTIKLQVNTDKQRQSTCSVNSGRSGTSNTSMKNRMNTSKIPLLTEIEVACEFIFSVSLMRLLFLTMCAQHQQFGSDHDNASAFAIEKALKLFGDAMEKNFLEHPFFKGMNIMPESLLTYEPGIKIGVRKLIQEMQRDWKRNIRR